METNDLLNFSIPSHAGGIGKTYEESIIVLMKNVRLWYAMKNKSNYIFFEDMENNIIDVIGFNETLEIKNGVFVNYDSVISNDKYKKLELMNIMPISEHEVLIELIDPEILKAHLNQERILKLEKRN